MKKIVLAAGIGLLLQTSAWAWWDTFGPVVKYPPKVAEVQAETVAAGAAVVADQPPVGPPAGGGKAVRLAPGKGSLTWKADLKRSIYVLFVVGRVPAADPVKHGGGPEWPMTVRLKVTGPDGRLVGDWDMTVNYLNTYVEMSRLHFPVHADGQYALELALGGDSKTDLLADRLELRDMLGQTFKKGFKKGRYLWTDDEVAQIRKTKNAPLPGQEPKLDPAKRAERLEAYKKAYGDSYAHWNKPLGNVSWRGYNPSLPLPAGQAYLDTGDPAQGLAATLIVMEAADWYPALDYRIVGPEQETMWRGRRWAPQGSRGEKIGWDYQAAPQLMRTYDVVFPFIVAHADELVAMIRTRVPWIKTRDDLIAFLDTHILQMIADHVNRLSITASEGGSEETMLTAAAVQGPNPAGDQMMRWLFTRTYMTISCDGGLQDHIISSFARDGNNLIGSAGYSQIPGGMLVSAARLTGRYAALGGNREFDLSDISRFPAVVPGASFVLDARVAGGFLPNVGDWGRAVNGPIRDTIGAYAERIRFAFDQTRDPRMAWLLRNVVKRSVETDAQWAEIERLAAGRRDPQLSSVSRNLMGFGLAILEAGSESDDPIRKRALAFRHGVGKGHGHADSLNLEYFSQGVRLIPDAGSRGGAPHPSDMRAHLGVSVDGNEMHNTEINTSATAWTTAFKPSPGAQYVAGAARFGSVPQVARYERQAALIDVAGAEASYVFDVLRVAGGREHVWHTHGPARTLADKPAYGLDLKAAASPEAQRILSAQLNPQEGVAGDLLMATWPMGREYEKGMLGAAFDEKAPSVQARSRLFGHAGNRVFIGDSDADKPGMENSQWLCTVGFVHVRAASDGDGLQTVWPQLIEGFRGQSLIKEARQVKAAPADVTAAAPVALAVETTTGQRDLLLADGEGSREVKADGATLVGRLGYISSDAAGLRLAHLVGGTKLEKDKLKIEAQSATYAARIVSVDYAVRQTTLDQDAPKALIGEEILIGASTHPQAWQVVAVEGKTLTLDKSAVLYQSQISAVDEKTGEVLCSINPPFLAADPRYYDGVTATDETGGRAWRVRKVEPRYLWMYLQEPNEEWSEIYSDEDFPDADGDGKRTVVVKNWGGDDVKRRPEIRVEVAFVDKALQIVYFKLPADEEIVRGSGWNWAGHKYIVGEDNRWLVNEKGRRWKPNFAGRQNVIALEGAVKDSDLADADKDGRRVLRMYHYGVGDTVTMPTSVYVARQTDGTFKVSASTPAQVTVAGKTVN